MSDRSLAVVTALLVVLLLAGQMWARYSRDQQAACLVRIVQMPLEERSEIVC